MLNCLIYKRKVINRIFSPERCGGRISAWVLEALPRGLIFQAFSLGRAEPEGFKVRIKVNDLCNDEI